MNQTLEYVLNKYETDPHSNSPVFLPYPRSDIAKLFGELNFKNGAEIGVLYGMFSKTLCESIPGLNLNCIDPWEIYDGLPENERKSGSHQRRIAKGQEKAEQALNGYSCKIIRKHSMDAVKDFARASLDFVYIDANHKFDYVMRDIIEWGKIVRPGGIVSGHDYHCFKHKEVSFDISSAVNTYAKAHDIKPVFVFTQERSTSWFFVNE